MQSQTSGKFRCSLNSSPVQMGRFGGGESRTMSPSPGVCGCGGAVIWHPSCCPEPLSHRRSRSAGWWMRPSALPRPGGCSQREQPRPAPSCGPAPPRDIVAAVPVPVPIPGSSPAPTHTTFCKTEILLWPWARLPWNLTRNLPELGAPFVQSLVFQHWKY